MQLKNTILLLLLLLHSPHSIHHRFSSIRKSLLFRSSLSLSLQMKKEASSILLTSEGREDVDEFVGISKSRLQRSLDLCPYDTAGCRSLELAFCILWGGNCDGFIWYSRFCYKTFAVERFFLSWIKKSIDWYRDSRHRP